MKSKLAIKDVHSCEVLRVAKCNESLSVSVLWEFEQWRGDKKIDEWSFKNTCTDEGLNRILDIMFHGTAQITTWYVLIFESNTTPDGSTTYATPVFTESTAYDETYRPEYVEAAASSKTTTNTANKATFTMNAGKTIYGSALVGGGTSGHTKGDAAGGGVMFCAGQFAASKVVVSTDVLLATISISVASG